MKKKIENLSSNSWDSESERCVNHFLQFVLFLSLFFFLLRFIVVVVVIWKRFCCLCCSHSLELIRELFILPFYLCFLYFSLVSQIIANFDGFERLNAASKRVGTIFFGFFVRFSLNMIVQQKISFLTILNSPAVFSDRMCFIEIT